jgi:ParB family chromosome partitioning protein
MLDMNVALLRPGRYQPRRHVPEESLAELGASIREQGVLQPLIVRPLERSRAGETATTHEIVAGERRWRAAQLIGMATVPVVVRELDDQSALAVALIENLQREDLNPIDQAQSLSRLAEDFKLTHQQVAEAVGRSRSSVSNLLRLLDLHDDVKELLVAGRIDMGHARAMLSLDGEQQLSIARKTEQSGLSVRQVERAVQTALSRTDANASPARPGVDIQTRWLQQQIARELGRKVSIRPRKGGRYALDMEFGDLTQLQEVLRSVQALIGQIQATAGPRARDSKNKVGDPD